MALVELSPLDEERFGIRTTKALVGDAAEAIAAVEESRDAGAKLLIVRCPSDELLVAQTLEEHGCRLMDVLVYFVRNLRKPPIPEESGDVTIRPIREGEAERVADVARASFTDYFGHYHADARLDRAKSDEVYVSWAYRSCVSRDLAQEVLVAEETTLLGFMTYRLNTPDEGEAVLGGVLPAAQGRGLYRRFIIRGMQWCAAQGASKMVVSTQISNIAVQRVWARLAFEPRNSYLTFHRWFA